MGRASTLPMPPFVPLMKRRSRVEEESRGKCGGGGERKRRAELDIEEQIDKRQREEGGQ